MLSKEQSDLLTQTGPGTPMGDMFRMYWIPALLTEELPENDCPPVRVKLLSESLLAFRDSEGRYGLIDEFCAHRRVSLWFGRNEEGGLRCAYHGWKYDTTGRCVDMPSESKDTGFANRIVLKSYPMIERGGILWTYMGPAEQPPPYPEWEFIMVGPEQTFTSKRWQENNWLQAMEGGIDSSHVSWLHGDSLHHDPLFRGAKGNPYMFTDKAPVFEVIESQGGLYIGARRNAEDGNYYWRITQYIVPTFTMIPPRGGHPLHGHFWIPIDHENCWAWSYDYHPTRAIKPEELEAMKAGRGIHARCIPGTYRPLANKENDYLINREKQKAGSLSSGVEGIAMQDASLQESMGRIVDRTKEHLGSSDKGIIMARQMLLRALKAMEKGQMPPGRLPEEQRVRSASLLLPVEQPFYEAAAEALRAKKGTEPVSV